MNNLLTLNVPAKSPFARDLDELDLGTHSASAELSPVKSDRKICKIIIDKFKSYKK